MSYLQLLQVQVPNSPDSCSWSSAYEDQLLMTKGDNNVGDDVELYGLDWLDRNLVVGKVRG